MRPAAKRQHVVLAGRVEFDIPEKHHFVVLFRVKLRDENIFRPLIVAAEEFLP